MSHPITVIYEEGGPGNEAVSKKKFQPNEDASISVSVLRRYFENFLTLKFVDEGMDVLLGFQKDKELNEVAVLPPEGGWGNREYFVVTNVPEPPRGSKRQLSVSDKATEATTSKQPRHEIEKENNPPQYLDWAKAVKKYMFCTNENLKKEGDMSCVVAFSRRYAVTYSHGCHKDFYARHTIRNLEGKKFKVYPLVQNENETKKEIAVEVVYIDAVRDFIILEAQGDNFFIDIDEDEDILSSPLKSKKYLAIGYSTSFRGQRGKFQRVEDTYNVGNIMNDTENCFRRIVGSNISVGGDSGGAIFSENYGLLGIIKGSCPDNKRTSIVPSWNFSLSLEIVRTGKCPQTPPSSYEE